MTKPGRSSANASRATIIDVARAASVSRQTVSNVVNAPERVAPHTRERVSAEIKRLGFRPNRAARSLKQSRAGALGLELNVTGSGRLGSILDEFLVALTERAASHDAHIVPFTADQDDPLTAYAQILSGRIADGFVLSDTHVNDPRPGWLRARGIPFAAFGRIWDDPSETAWVDVDGAAGVHAAVRHLYANGWDRIGCLGWPAGSPVGDDRRNGWTTATTELGVANRSWSAVTTQDLAAAARDVAPLIDALGRGGALVCVSDVLALGAWEVLTARGWRIGEDFAVVGFDDSEMAELLGLTSIRQPVGEVADRVLDLLGNTEPQDTAPRGVLLTPELVVRSSSSPAGHRTTERGTT